MPPSTRKSRPVTRSYALAPALRQKRFNSRRGSVKRAHGGSLHVLQAEARRQNTLTQMDFVRLGQTPALEIDDISYLEYEPVVKQEVQVEPKLEAGIDEELVVPKKVVPDTGKRKSGMENEEVKRIKREDEPNGIIDTAEEVALTTHRPLKRKRNSGARPVREISTDSSEKTPLPPRSPNLQIPIGAEKPDHDAEPRKPAGRSARRSGDNSEARTKSTGNIKVEAGVSQEADVPENLPTACSGAQLTAIQLPVTNNSSDFVRSAHPNPSRFSDPEMTIPDSEDEGETQPTTIQSPETFTTSRIPKLPSQKSFSQATTVDVTQPTQRPPLTEPASSPSKAGSPSSGRSINTPAQQSNSITCSSPYISSLSATGRNDADSITDSQLLPESVMGFELPRLPGWSQNSDE